MDFVWRIAETDAVSDFLHDCANATPSAKLTIAVPAMIQIWRDFIGSRNGTYSGASVGLLGGALIGRGRGPVPASPTAACVRIAEAMDVASFWR